MFTRSATKGLVGLLVFVMVLLGLYPLQTAANTTATKMQIVSRALNGDTKKGGGTYPVVSANGQYVAFISGSPDLVDKDTNEKVDVFVYARQTGKITRVSVASNGTQGNGYSGNYVSISGDGQIIAFESDATNLDPDDKNNHKDIFVHDMNTHTTKRVSVTSDGFEANYDSLQPQISENGRYVVFASYGDFDGANNAMDVFLHDLTTGKTRWVSRNYDGSSSVLSAVRPSVSTSGIVTFYSNLIKLLPDGKSGGEDIYVYDHNTGKMEIISVGYNGSRANQSSHDPHISADGRFVTYTSAASNLVEKDTNQAYDVFQYDRQSGKTDLVSVNPNGKQGPGSSFNSSSSSDGRFITFEYLTGSEPNTPYNKHLVYLRDTVNVTTTMVSVSQSGSYPNGDSGLGLGQSVSGDGNVVTFYSYASDLSTPDDNRTEDVFVYDRTVELPPTPTPTPEPPGINLQPIVFIPGIGGSNLVGQNGEELWPGQHNKPFFLNRDALHKRLTLNPSQLRETVIASDATRHINVGAYFDQEAYSSLIQMFVDAGYKEYEVNGDPKLRTEANCDLGQTTDGIKPNFFVFGYDWRYGMVNDNATNVGLSSTNPTLLKEYVGCVRKYYPDTDITIVAHSMGGLVAWKYILDNPTDHHIRKLITIGTPWLGSPKSISALVTGNFNMLAIWLSTAKELLQYFPGGHQLLPSREYFRVAGSPLAVKELKDTGWVETLLRKVDYPEYAHFLKQNYGSNTVNFLASNESLHFQPHFDDWSNFSIPIEEVHIIYSEGLADDTIGSFIELHLTSCSIDHVCSNHMVPDVEYTLGDKTVPVFSSSRTGNGINLNNPQVKLHRFKQRDNLLWFNENVEHLGLTENPRVQTCILNILGLTTDECEEDTPTVQAAATDEVVDEANYIRLWGVKSVIITDGISTTSEIMTDTVRAEPLPGMSYEKLGGNAVSLVFSPNQVFTLTLVADDYMMGELSVGTGSKKREVIGYTDQIVEPGGHVAIVVSNLGLQPMRYDNDDDGVYETSLTPTSHVTGDILDLVPPKLRFNLGDNSLMIEAVDDGGVKWVQFSYDGSTYNKYEHELLVAPGQVIYAFAQDLVGNRSGIVSYAVPQAVTNRLFLPLVNR
jgi:hypothetical protein